MTDLTPDPLEPHFLRVAILSSEYPPHTFGGLGTHIAGITTAIAPSVDCELYIPAHSDYLPIHPNVHLHMVPMEQEASNLELWFEYSRAAVQSVLDTHPKPDIVHCHDWMTAIAGIKLRGLLGIPLVYNVHLPQFRGTTRHIENLALVAADLVLVNSESVRRELQGHRLPIRRIEVVPNGVDTGIFHPSAGWPGDDGYILFAGRLVPQKGVDVLLKAFAAVLRRCGNARLTIAGTGELELYFERMARYLGVFQQISFVRWQTGTDLVHLFQHCKMLVIPSYYEPFGIVALEAMACGRPVIASSVGGLPEFIEHGQQGYLVPPGDHLQLARRIVELLEHPELDMAMGKAALRRSHSYTWKAAADMTCSLYNQARQAGSRKEDSRVVYGLERELMRGLDPDLRPGMRDLLSNKS